MAFMSSTKLIPETPRPIARFSANVNSKGRWQRRAPGNDSIRPPGACLQPSTSGRAICRHTVRTDTHCASTRPHPAERRRQRTEPATNSSTAVNCRNRPKTVPRHECVSTRNKPHANEPGGPTTSRAPQIHRSGVHDYRYWRQQSGPQRIWDQANEPRATKFVPRPRIDPPQASRYSGSEIEEGQSRHGVET